MRRSLWVGRVVGGAGTSTQACEAATWSRRSEVCQSLAPVARNLHIVVEESNPLGHLLLHARASRGETTTVVVARGGKRLRSLLLRAAVRDFRRSASTARQPAFRAAAGPRPCVWRTVSGAEVSGRSAQRQHDADRQRPRCRSAIGCRPRVRPAQLDPASMVGMTTAYDGSIMVAAPGADGERIDRCRAEELQRVPRTVHHGTPYGVEVGLDHHRDIGELIEGCQQACRQRVSEASTV